jgi:hypothetical protein
MLRTVFGSFLAVAILAGGALGDDTKSGKQKEEQERLKKEGKKATITKVDPKHGTVEVKMKNDKGKEVNKTFHLTRDIFYFDSTGRVVDIDVFRSGDDILVVEREGKLHAMQQDKKNDRSGKTGASTKKDDKNRR